VVAALILSIAPPTAAQSVGDPTLTVETVATGLLQPTSMAFLGVGDLLVLQKGNGQVRRILGGVLQTAPVLDVAVHASSERGLLGIALDPAFALNRFVYLYYTESSTGQDTTSSLVEPLGNRIYRYVWDGAALVGPVLLVDLPATPGPNHDGGVIAFGPDGALYAVIGDLNRNGRLQNFPAGPDPDDTGVVLRMGRDGRGLADNPFFGAAGAGLMDRVFAYGVRNSFGLAFDPVTGSLWDSENGPGSYDEINRVFPGFNSGWEQLMGPDARDPQGLGDLWVVPGSRYADPALSWAVPVAPTGMTFVASPRFGCGYLNDLLVGDNNCGQIYRLRLNGARDDLLLTGQPLSDRVADNAGATCVSAEMDEIRFGTGFGVVTDLENGPDGRIYVVSLSRGAVYRIGPRPGASPDGDGDGAPDACDCAPADPSAYAPPGEVRGLVHSPAGLDWSPLSAAAGPGTTYSIVTAPLQALRRDRDFRAACTLAELLPGPPYTDARAPAPPGDGDLYLVRAANTCGAGPFGDASFTPDPRDLLDLMPPPPCPCAGRTGGALIRFRIAGEYLSVWIEEPAFIDRARDILAGGVSQIPLFDSLLDGTGCDPQWTWHVDPRKVRFVDSAIELCDGLPSHIEADKEYWLGTVGSYCPWTAIVEAVDDRR
jgi:glucose/arabinose dehydrogenase